MWASKPRRASQGTRSAGSETGFFSYIEPVSVQSNRISANTIRRLEFGDQRPAREIGPVATENLENYASETA
jgi:hypothetical protein